MGNFELDPMALSPEEIVLFPGPAGDLEGRWRPPRPGRSPSGTVVVAHPHPALGGTLLNKVVFHTARTLNHDLDFASLRFNFRGVGKSMGVYDRGRGEVGDVQSAWAEARRRVPGGTLLGAGFSFGGAMTLHAAAREGADQAPRALAVLGLPIHLVPPPRPFPASIPLVAVHGDDDQFTPSEQVEEYVDSWPGPKALLVIPGADHFLEGSLPRATEFLSRQLREWL